MRTCIDARFLEEAAAHALRFRCDDCAHFEPSRDSCEHGYPTAPHRPLKLEVGRFIVFCKEFELTSRFEATGG